MNETLLLDIDSDGIGVLTFNRPDVMNALDITTMRQFAATIDDLAQDESLRVLILTGSGARAFCSGADLYEQATYPTADDAREMITCMGDALLTLERLPVPVIAAINGYALGGGSEIALACDIRIVDEKARIGLVQIRMGVTPGWGAGQRLLRLIGYPRTMEFLLRGHVMRIQELQDLGLVNQVVNEGRAQFHAVNFARHIAQSPPNVVRGIKALLQAGLNQPYEQALMIERDIFPPLWEDKPHKQAVMDFMAKQDARKNGG